MFGMIGTDRRSIGNFQLLDQLIDVKSDTIIFERIKYYAKITK